MTTARQKVLTYFEKSRQASAREIARALKMSPATVRHHLRVLISDGRLEMAAMRIRGPDGRGRPENIYTLPRAALGDNLSALSDALLTEAGSGVSVEALAHRLVGEFNMADQPLAKRLSFAVEKMNQMNHHAHWEAGPEGPRILFGHCPYAAIIDKHPELCKMDASILQQLMVQSVRQIFRAGKDGSSVCVFVIGR
jgi:predicted ArsR family transcriptional regulator